MISTISEKMKKMMSTGNSPRVRKWVCILTTVVAFVLVSTPSYALLLDPARTALEGDLTASGFANPEVVGLFFGLLEFVLIAIPVGTGSMALANMNRGTEAWLPWITTMGGSLVFIAFITVLVGNIYGTAAA